MSTKRQRRERRREAVTRTIRAAMHLHRRRGVPKVEKPMGQEKLP